jgi:hypothetical protein
MQHFDNDDESYLTWLGTHQDSYVLNVNRTPEPDNLRLHRASCRHLAKAPANGARWTTHYTKYCGERAELEHRAVELGGEPWPCPDCL